MVQEQRTTLPHSRILPSSRFVSPTTASTETTPTPTMRITVRTLRQGWSKEIEVRDWVTVGELRVVCAKAASVSDASRCKLVLRGLALVDDTQVAPLKPRDTVLVASVPVEASRSGDDGNLMRCRSGAATTSSRGNDLHRPRWEEGTEGNNTPTNLTSTCLHVYVFLVRRIKVPVGVAMALVSVSKVQWAKIITWLFLSQLAASHGHSLPFLIFSGFYLIFTNLGTRREGEPSAYSIFNNFQELPGNFNAQRVDDTIMRRN